MIIFVILAYVAVQIAIAAWAARDTKSDADYLVAGRKLGTFAVAMSVFATWFASETVIATSSEVAAFGMAGARIEPFAFGLGILVLGLFVAGKLRAGGHITLADYLGTKFGPRTEALSALTIAASGTMWAGAQLYALATIISASSGISFELALGASTAIVLTYTLLGGLVGDVVTDVIQGIILIIGMGILLVLIVVAAGGWGAAVSSIPAERWRFSGEDETWLDQIDIWIIPIIGSIVSQEAISRTLGAKSVSVARNGAIIGSLIYMAVGLLPVAFGLFGPHLGITLGEGDEFLPSLARELFPPWLYVVFTGALLSAILSSVDSALLAVSAVATETGYRRLKPDMSAAESLRAARATTVLAGLLALGIAASGESLRQIVIDAVSINGIIAVPLVMALAGMYKTRLPVAAITIVVQLLALLWMQWHLELSGAFIYTMGLGLAVYGVLYGVDRALIRKPQVTGQGSAVP